MSNSGRRPVLESIGSMEAKLQSLQQAVTALEKSNALVQETLVELTSEMKRWQTAPRPAAEGEEWLLVRRVSE